MKQLFILAAVTALAVARPELYKENEDFQFSRSSTDEGSKSGYYGAQRGNMGGNYERAHNMDSLAQNQMSGLVRQVEGELGDGAKTKSGSVYSAANSRGTYGSGHFDLSNLAGRNFQEGTYHDNSNSHTSQLQSGSAYNSAGYTNTRSQAYGGSRYGGHQRAASDAQTQTEDLQSLDNSQANSQYDYGRSSSHSSGYQAHAGFQEHSEYDHSNANSHSGYGSNVRTRLVSASPVRVILTPGGRVAIPIAAQTYDVRQGSSLIDQNALNSESDSLRQSNYGSSYEPSNAKRYESSYSYRKKWEKHDTIPTAEVILTPTESPFPRNSELYEDTDARRMSSHINAGGVDALTAHSSSASGRYDAVKSSSSQSRYHSNHNTQLGVDSASSNSNAYTHTGYNAGSNNGVSSDSVNGYQDVYGTGSRYHGASNLNAHTQTGFNTGSHSDLNSQVEDLNAKPKSYQSSYSYHKSWERQGDPYIIKPASSGYTDSQASQRLTSSTKTGAAYHSGSQYGHNQADCDENDHIRVARSYNSDALEQQSQKQWSDSEDMNQQLQGNWEQQNVGQQSQNRWENLEDLNQQSQSSWDQQNLEQQSENRFDKLEDLNQQSQSNWDQLNEGQQSQSNWDFQQSQKTENDSQQTTWDKPEDIRQQLQNTNSNLVNFGQQTQNTVGLGEHSQAFDTETGFKSIDQHITQQQIFEHNKPIVENEFHEEPQKAGQWGTFDVNDLNKYNVTTQQHSTAENKYTTENDQLNQNIKPHWQQADIFFQNHGNSDIDKTYENFHHNVNQEHYGQIWNSRNVNAPSYPVINDLQATSRVPPLAQLWNKFYSIEKKSGLSTQVRDSETYHIDNHQSASQSKPALVDKPSQNKTNNDLTSINKLEATKYKYIATNSTAESEENKLEVQPLSTNIQSDNEELERPEDKGRGDIDLEDLSSDSGENNKHFKRTPETHHNTNRDMNIEQNFDNFAEISQQNDKIEEQNHYILQQNIAVSKQNVNFEQGNLQENNFENKKHFGQQNITQHNNNQEQSEDSGQPTENLQQQSLNNFEQDQLHNFEQVGSLQDFGQQNLNQQSLQGFDQKIGQDTQSPQQQNLEDFKEENLQDFGQQNVKLEQQHFHSFDQKSNQDYGQTIGNQKQQNLDNFNHESLPNLGVQNEYRDQNLHNMEHLQHINQYSEHQSLHNLDQTRDQEFRQTIDGQQHKNSDNFFQESSQHFEQNSHDIGQKNFEIFVPQNENIEQHAFGQENLQEHGNLEEQNIQDFGQSYFQDFGQQNENLEQQIAQSPSEYKTIEQQKEVNLKQLQQVNKAHLMEQHNSNIQQGFEQVLDQQYEQPQQSSDSLEQSVKNNTKLFFPLHNQQHEEVEEPIVIQRQYMNSNTPKISDSTIVETPVEYTTPKPGFWSSVGNKFSNAKIKIVSWFKNDN